MRRHQRKNHAPENQLRWGKLPHNALTRGLRDFIDSMGARGLSFLTLRGRLHAIKRFILWADERGLSDPREITLPILERYQSYLYHFRKPNGEPLSFSSQAAELAPLRAFFKWLTRQHIILYNPASELQLPKINKNLARYVLSIENVEKILAVPDTSTLLGLRDRAILEVLYSSGIRRSEIRRLSIYDVDTQRGTLLVRNGKGAKDRIVPLGERACAWVEKYLRDVRPQFVTARDDGVMFLTFHGDSFTGYAIGDTVKEYILKSGVPVNGSCHLFRHACATHMLDNGADTRFIQALLGHASLESTQIYTQVALSKLIAVHAATHPAKVKSTDAIKPPPIDPHTLAQRQQILDALTAEADADENSDDKTPMDEPPSSALFRVPYHPRPGRRGPRGPRKKKDEHADADADADVDA